jgi:hypothetical protein
VTPPATTTKVRTRCVGSPVSVLHGDRNIELAIETPGAAEYGAAPHEGRVETEPCPPRQVMGAPVIRTGDGLIPVDHDRPLTLQ